MLKIIIPTISLAFFSTLAAAQVQYKKDPSLSVSAGLSGFNNTRPALSLGIGFLDGITGRLEYAVGFQGSSVRYPFRKKPVPVTKKILFEGDASLRLKLFTDARTLTPYISAGVGVSSYGPVMAAFAPLGPGAQLRLGNGVFLCTDIQYRSPLSGDASQHFVYSVSLTGSLKPRRGRQQVPLPQAPVQRPVIVRVADMDGDGIADSADSCPAVPGLTRYKGCPVPDTDGDGINDEADRCPLVPGVARYNGCPVPDTDGDGLDDEADGCPFVAGPLSNRGCPARAALQDSLDILARSVFFETGRTVLREESYVTLGAVARLLVADPSIKLVVEGHTDNTGTVTGNKRLGEGRAAAVVAYLVRAGITEGRLASYGMGSSRPVAENNTVAGRAANRRVEFKVTK